MEEKYALVFNLDRVGRLLDAQPYRHLRFPAARFAPALLQELLQQCAQSVRLDGEEVEIALCYVQRRFRPLNLYLREQGPEGMRAAVLDYAQAITDMARNNIFPGDMLPKNFGVSRHGRAVFYDYDELCLVTECQFRALPENSDEYDSAAREDVFYVGPHDVFPQQFPNFRRDRYGMIAGSGVQFLDIAAIAPVAHQVFETLEFLGDGVECGSGCCRRHCPYTQTQLASHRSERSFHKPGLGIVYRLLLNA